MDRWKARFLQGAGILLQAGAAVLFVIAGDEGALAAAVIGAATGAGGLYLWGAGARERALEWQGQPGTMEHLEQMEQHLYTLQDDVALLLDEREASRDALTPMPGDRDRQQPRLRQDYRTDRH
jgi:hypothetical protein